MTLSMILTHLALVVAALVFAILAGVPLGILCYFYPSARRVVLRVVDLIQTTPALALLGIIMVFMGAGKPTVIVGLALYSLLPIVRNTHLGLSQVPEYLIEAGRGIKAGWGIEAGESIEAGNDWGIYAGTHAKISSDLRRVVAKTRPRNLMSGEFLELKE